MVRSIVRRGELASRWRRVVETHPATRAVLARNGASSSGRCAVARVRWEPATTRADAASAALLTGARQLDLATPGRHSASALSLPVHESASAAVAAGVVEDARAWHRNGVLRRMRLDVGVAAAPASLAASAAAAADAIDAATGSAQPAETDTVLAAAGEAEAEGVSSPAGHGHARFFAVAPQFGRMVSVRESANRLCWRVTAHRLERGRNHSSADAGDGDVGASRSAMQLSQLIESL